MLDYYDNHKEALKILNNYAFNNNFPPNPNAHVYLYQYLKRQDSSKRKLFRVLKVYLCIDQPDIHYIIFCLLQYNEEQLQAFCETVYKSG